MYLQLIIDDKIHREWYLDEERFFWGGSGMTMEERSLRNKKIIDDKVLEIKQDYWVDLSSCQSWSIQLSIKSKLNYFTHTEMDEQWQRQ